MHECFKRYSAMSPMIFKRFLECFVHFLIGAPLGPRHQAQTSGDFQWRDRLVQIARHVEVIAHVLKAAVLQGTAHLRLSPEALGAAFSGALQAKSSTASLANAVVDEVFRSYRLLSEEELGALRQAGAANQELIISAVISAKTRQPAGQVRQEVQSGSRTWGALLQSANLDPGSLPREIAAILQLQAR